jgi:hypothetical protein
MHITNIYTPLDDYSIQISLSQEQHAVIDADDLALIQGYTWCAIKVTGAKTFYDITNVKQQNGTFKQVYMHRLITNSPDNMEIDHLNKNGLDNRKNNLKVCTSLEHRLRHMSLMTHCHRGHPLTDENTRITSWGTRQCCTCHPHQTKQRQAKYKPRGERQSRAEWLEQCKQLRDQEREQREQEQREQRFQWCLSISHPILRQAVMLFDGNMSSLARHLGVSRQAVDSWNSRQTIPKHRLPLIVQLIEGRK